MRNIRAWLKVFLFLPKVRIEILLLSVSVFLALQAGVYAQVTFQVASTPVTTVSNTDNTARAGDITFTNANSEPSALGTITVQYGAPITVPFSAVSISAPTDSEYATNLPTVNISASSNGNGLLVINVPSGVSGFGSSFSVSGVRLQIPGHTSPPPPAGAGSANISCTDNSIISGQTSVTVINSVFPGIGSLSGTPGLIDGVAGVLTVPPIVGAREGYLNAFDYSLSGNTTAVMVRFHVDQAPPAGVTVIFPAQAFAGSSEWRTASSNGSNLNLPVEITSSNLDVYYKAINSIEPFQTVSNPTIIETLSVPVTIDVTSFPLVAMTISYTASLAPIGPAFDGVNVISAPVPRFDASEVGPATLFSITGGIQASVAILLNPDGGTNEYKFPDDASNFYNYKVTYPPIGGLETDAVDLVVTPIFITQPELEAVLGGQFPGATLVRYDSTNNDFTDNHGVLFRTSCQNHVTHEPMPCPTPGVYDVRTSWNSPSGQLITNPAFLKLPGGSSTWENIFTEFLETRIDPTGSGRTCCSYSDFVFVDSVSGTSPTINMNSPINGAIYLLNQQVWADYDCTGTTVTSCLGTRPSGSLIDTSSLGTKSFEVNATVSSGPSADAKVSYQVGLYNVDGCLLYDPSRSVKKGATYPIKLQLCGAAGQNLSAPSLVLNALRVVKLDSSPDGPPLSDSGNANPDNNFRFDSSLGPGYIYNLSTRPLSAGTFYVEFVVTGDLTRYRAYFNVK